MVSSIFSDYTKVDVVIAVFLIYQGLRGYIKGVRYVIFDTVKFFGSYFLTKIAYQLFYQSVAKTVWFQSLLNLLRDKVLNRLCELFPIVSFFPWDSIVFCTVVFCGIFLLFRIALFGFSKEVTFLQKTEGFVLGIIKGVAYLFVLISIAEPLLQGFSILGFSEWLQNSKILPYLYEYNFLLDFLSFY